MGESKLRITLEFDDETALGDFREYLLDWRGSEARMDRAVAPRETARHAIEAGDAAAHALSTVARVLDTDGKELGEDPRCGCCHHYQESECLRGECENGPQRCSQCEDDGEDDE
jgi:hypothetical protein